MTLTAIIVTAVLILPVLLPVVELLFPSWCFSRYSWEHRVLSYDPSLYYDLLLLDAAIESRYDKQERRAAHRRLQAWIKGYNPATTVERCHDTGVTYVTYQDGSVMRTYPASETFAL